MAYSPLEQGRIDGDATLESIGERHGATPSQVALAWILRRAGTMAIPKAGSLAHVRENAAAAGLTLSPKDLADLDRVFPVPVRATPLAML